MSDVSDDTKLNRGGQYTQLLSLAVHEFRTPASIVGGYLRMLQRDSEAPLNERQLKMIDEAAKSCARIVAIVDEMSEIGKLDSGQITLARNPIDLFALVAEVAELVHEASDREVHLTVRGIDHGAAMMGDAPRLRTAFDAIFRAILREKAGPASMIAERRFVTDDRGTAATVIVCEETSVQDAYERAPVAFEEKQRGGLGLALPLARRVIEGHGGRIWSPAPLGDDDSLKRGAAIISLPIRS
jgi:signal transduction histidine kinase